MNNIELLTYKGLKCVNCEVSVIDIINKFGICYRSFHFHHIDKDKKDKNYNNIINRKLCIAQLKELDKCILLCSICHGIIHGQKISAIVDLEIKFNGREIKKQLSGQIIVNRNSKKSNFFTDQMLDLSIYIITIRSSHHYQMLGFEMDDDFKKNLLNDAVIHKEISIYNNNSKTTVMTLNHDGENRVNISQNIGFYHGVHTEFKNISQKKPFFSSHNGFAINSSRELLSSGVINYQIEIN